MSIIHIRKKTVRPVMEQHNSIIQTKRSDLSIPSPPERIIRMMDSVRMMNGKRNILIEEYEEM